MDRRRFMKVAGVAGMSVMAPIALRDREARAGSGAYGGPFWIMVHASGGWDATMLTDPKGGTSGDASSVDQAYSASAIGKAGNISYAPISYTTNGVVVQSHQAFFEAHYKRLTVINGVDTETNNHDAGVRTTWCGQLAEGYPSFAAMVAAKVTATQSLPLAYVSYGGYDNTEGLISLTRVSDPTALEKLAFTSEANPSNMSSPDPYFSNNTAARIQAAQAGRLQALANKQTLPTSSSAMNSLYLARQSTSGLTVLGNALKATTLTTSNDLPGLNGVSGLDDLTSFVQQAQIALLGFKSGVAVSANLIYGGFDTHSNNDTQQIRQQSVMLRGIDYLFNQIDAMGLTNQVYVCIGSDFSRTPYYNAGNGKDHWNITSMMFAGPTIPGNVVLGGTDATFTSTLVDPMTLKPSMTGERINTTHVHHALRKAAGLTGGTLDNEFALPGDTMPLFG